MEKNADIKRGVDFETRVEAAVPLSEAFAWWKEGRLNKKTLLFLSSVCILNLIIVFPIFGRDLTSAYSSSVFLVMISEFFHRFINLPQNSFFSVLTFFSFTFAPVSLYLFVRKIAMRNEITALIATLLFILPNPFFGDVPILVAAVLRGDGAHVLSVSFIPFFLLYVQMFIATGVPLLFFLTAIGISYIAVISPFAAFNSIIFFGVLIIAEGFQGNLRIKLIRALVLIVTAGGLSLFWYYPTTVLKFVDSPYIQHVISKFLGIMPAAIPIIPVVGALSFLIFDRRAQLKPVFVSLSIFLIYITLYWVNNQLSIVGIFSAERYLPELALSVSLILAILFVLIIEIVIRRAYPKMKARQAYFGLIFSITFGIVLVGFLTYSAIGTVHAYIQSEKIIGSYNEGVFGLGGFIDWSDFSSIGASLVSLTTFAFLVYILRKYPSVVKT